MGSILMIRGFFTKLPTEEANQPLPISLVPEPATT